MSITKTTVDLLIHSKYILPIIPKRTVLKNSCIAISKGKIVDILDSKTSQQKYKVKHPQNEVFKMDHVLMPGLINAHTHTPMNILKGYADDLSLGDWLYKMVFPTERHLLKTEPENYVSIGARASIYEMLSTGTTTFNDMYMYPETIVETALETGIRAAVSFPLFRIAPEFDPYVDQYEERVHKVMKTNYNNKIFPVLAGHAPYTVNDDDFATLKRLTEKYQTKLNVHLHETPEAIKMQYEKDHIRPIERLDKLGIINSNLIAIHMTDLTQQEIELCKRKKVNIVHCPVSNLKLASGICPVQKLLDAGVNVALGTDSSCSNNNLDMFEEMKIASLIGKIYRHEERNSENANSWDVLDMATINGARSLGLQKKIGSIEKGKLADIIAIDINSSVNSLPVYDLSSSIVYSLGNSKYLTDVWVDGQRVVENKKVKTIDHNKIISDIKYFNEKLLKFKKSLLK
ncbi:aminohydrolase ssna-related [Anaeramoeba flamelloides]|uniref:Aminohydrolase ssna-related n=1 Tax=Anaeramoeba flamelloides TaxID=1746091 RepID=A0AAV7ZG84_9EUKA|nr:aminohydrolase ssna-related [Anaeramoeba flamelloides]